MKTQLPLLASTRNASGVNIIVHLTQYEILIKNINVLQATTNSFSVLKHLNGTM